ncbi:predicted protein [Chaetoceros tenuissimus]|uniref:Uncharacterized protein n=1 Tax=Chaetoceros tenuissimus TaxID=426638 RepID=A0AAD3HBE5_9STRA|nr:predicted protein [Chaetoceros tenuissimus]
MPIDNSSDDDSTFQPLEDAVLVQPTAYKKADNAEDDSSSSSSEGSVDDESDVEKKSESVARTIEDAVVEDHHDSPVTVTREDDSRSSNKEDENNHHAQSFDESNEYNEESESFNTSDQPNTILDFDESLRKISLLKRKEAEEEKKSTNHAATSEPAKGIPSTLGTSTSGNKIKYHGEDSNAKQKDKNEASIDTHDNKGKCDGKDEAQFDLVDDEQPFGDQSGSGSDIKRSDVIQTIDQYDSTEITSSSMEVQNSKQDQSQATKKALKVPSPATSISDKENSKGSIIAADSGAPSSNSNQSSSSRESDAASDPKPKEKETSPNEHSTQGEVHSAKSEIAASNPASFSLFKNAIEFATPNENDASSETECKEKKFDSDPTASSSPPSEHTTQDQKEIDLESTKSSPLLHNNASSNPKVEGKAAASSPQDKMNHENEQIDLTSPLSTPLIVPASKGQALDTSKNDASSDNQKNTSKVHSKPYNNNRRRPYSGQRKRKLEVDDEALNRIFPDD